MRVPFHVPHYVTWELTLACNLNCLHCGSSAGAKRINELSDEETLDLCDQLGKCGTKKLTLSGGEPFLRKNWFDIAKRLNDNGIKVYIVTNGYYVAENIELLKKLNIGQIGISVDGDPETHNHIRQRPDAYDKVVEAFEALKKANIKRAAITFVSKWNVNKLENIYRSLKDMGVNNWQIQVAFGGGRMRGNEDFLPDDDDFVNIAHFIIEKRLGYKKTSVFDKNDDLNVYPADCVGYYTSWGPYLTNEPWDGCAAGIWAIGIESNGNIKGCLSILPELRDRKENKFIEGNIKEESLEKIWNDPERFSYNRKFDSRKTRGFCKKCEHVKKCRCGCTSMAYFYTGTTYNNPFCLYRIASERVGDENNTPVGNLKGNSSDSGEKRSTCMCAADIDNKKSSLLIY